MSASNGNETAKAIWGVLTSEIYLNRELNPTNAADALGFIGKGIHEVAEALNRIADALSNTDAKVSKTDADSRF